MMLTDAPTAKTTWPVWGLTAQVTVTRPETIDEAQSIAEGILESVDRACSRFRPDSELALKARELEHGTEVTPMLALLMEHALLAAASSEGSVDPTLGRDLANQGYDRDFSLLDTSSRIPIFTTRPTPRRDSQPGWTRVQLDGTRLTVPADLEIDLGATAKAVAADMIADTIATRCQTGVLVNLGGDLASAGLEPEQGWQILVQDLPQDPRQQISLHTGAAIATSSTQKRAWNSRSGRVHHILDPLSGLPAAAHWKSVSVVGTTCFEANTYSTAAVVRGQSALRWLAAKGRAARLVDQENRVFVTGEWPDEPSQSPQS
jgi:thiamine biosynthesis lipoprotein